MVSNSSNEFIPMRPVTYWKVCIDYRKFNTQTEKDYFPISFIDQMLDRLAGKGWYYFLEGYLDYNQISISQRTKTIKPLHVTMETLHSSGYPFDYLMHQQHFIRYMMSIFTDMVEDTIKVFMDDFSVVGDQFKDCLRHLHDVLRWCEEYHLVLNWERSHLLVKEGINLGHRISIKSIEVDRV